MCVIWEVILGNDFTEQADIWSAAVCIFKIVSGEQFGPFRLFRKAKMTKEYVQEAFNIEKIEWPPYASPECKEVLLASFAFFPSKRPTAHERNPLYGILMMMLWVLLYPWFTSDEQSQNFIDDDAMARLRMFAHRGKLQHALTPLMLEQAKREYKDDKIIEIAKKVHAKAVTIFWIIRLCKLDLIRKCGITIPLHFLKKIHLRMDCILETSKKYLQAKRLFSTSNFEKQN